MIMSTPAKEDVLNLAIQQRLIKLFEKVFDGFAVLFYNPYDSTFISRLSCVPNVISEYKNLFKEYGVTFGTNDPIIQAFDSGQCIFASKKLILALSNENLKSKDTGDDSEYSSNGVYDERSVLRFERLDIFDSCSIPLKINEKTFGVCFGFNNKQEVDRKKVDECYKSLYADDLLKEINECEKRELFKDRERVVANMINERRKFFDLVGNINTLSNKEQIYQVMIRHLLENYPFDMATITTEEGEELVYRDCNIINQDYREQFLEYREIFLGEDGKKHRYRKNAIDGAVPACFLQNAHIFLKDVSVFDSSKMSRVDKIVVSTIPMRSVVHFPIKHKHKPIGVLTLVTFEEVVDLSQDKKELLYMIASFMGSAIKNAEMYYRLDKQHDELKKQQEVIVDLNRQLANSNKKLTYMTNHDKLTGLKSYQAYHKDFGRAIAVASQEGTHLAILVVDIDHFKSFNDTYGHGNGNSCLEEFAKRLVATLRDRDIPCRYGGEEFAIILPGCTLSIAKKIAERIRSQITRSSFYIDNLAIDVTASFGIAAYQKNDTIDSMFSRADDALYYAKESGRDCVRTSEDIPNNFEKNTKKKKR